MSMHSPTELEAFYSFLADTLCSRAIGETPLKTPGCANGGRRASLKRLARIFARDMPTWEAGLGRPLAEVADQIRRRRNPGIVSSLPVPSGLLAGTAT